MTPHPPDSRMAASAFRPSPGSPAATAVQIGKGVSTAPTWSAPCWKAATMGEQQSGWTPLLRGNRSMNPRSKNSLKPFQRAALFVPQPMGTMTAAGACQSSCSMISKACGFCPSELVHELRELVEIRVLHDVLDRLREA